MFAAIAASPCLAVAQGNASTRARPAVSDTVVVTASRLPTERRTTGRRVVVWTAADIAAQPDMSITDVLRTMGGVAVQSRAGFGVQSDFSMRGSNFKGVLVLLDGIPINGPQSAHYLGGFPVPLSTIARIEVLRGPATAVYGPDAVGGVIQLFTYAGLRARGDAPVNWAGSGNVAYGAHALHDIGATLRNSFGRTTLYAASSWQGSDGEAIYNDQGQRVQSIKGPLSTDFSRRTYTGAVTQPVGDAMLYARVGFDRRNRNAYHFYTEFASDRARGTNRTDWLQLRLRGQSSSDTRWNIQLAARRHDSLYLYNPKLPHNWDQNRKVALQAWLSRTLTPRLTLTGGVSGEARGMDSPSKGDHSDGTGGVFVASRWQATQYLTVNTSGRIDHNSAYGTEVTPHISVAYNHNDYTLRAAAGRSLRAPNYTERFINTAVANPSGNLGNPNLDAEEAWSVEVGGDVYPTPGLSFHATAFYRKADHLIDWARVSNEDLYVARNIFGGKTRGVELETRWQHTAGTVQWSMRGSYTRLWADVDAPAKNIDYKYALTSAKQLVQGSVRMTAGRFSVGLNGLYKDRRSRSSYGVINGRFGFSPAWGGTPIQLSLRVRNILDAEYTDIFDAPMPGRWWVMGVKVAW